MPSFSDTKRHGWRLQRSASDGAVITLVAGCGEYTALFECADRCADSLGDRGLKDMGDGIFERIASYKIPSELLWAALQKLSKRYSVAIVEYVCDKRDSGRYILLWRIASDSLPVPPPAPIPGASTNLDDY